MALPDSQKTFLLNTGAEIPAIGFGTWKAVPGEAGKAVEVAFETGYRHFDCAPLYYNEAEIGCAFAKTKVPRAKYFVTTKLWSSDHNRASFALDRSLKDLQLDYVDLYLMHWPVSLDHSTGAEYGKEDRINSHLQGWDFRKTWVLMEELLDTGKVKAIGVANFSTQNLERLLQSCKVVPAVNQTELHPLLPQRKLHQYCVEKGIHQTAFGPLGGSGSTLHENRVITEIGKKHRKSPAAIMLSWGVQSGWSVVPKSVNPGRIRANLHDVFHLTKEEMSMIDGLSVDGGRRFNRPNWGTELFHDDEENIA